MEYQPLDYEKDEIRILRLVENAEGTVSCTLENVSLKCSPKYKALSYCWGAETEKKNILINGVLVEITPSLEIALRQFQTEDHGPLWIDALSINQKDLGERAKQIPRMADIYSQATEVIVWLGPAEDGSNEAMALMKLLRDEAPAGVLFAPGGAPLVAEETSVDPITPWTALEKLFGREYWRRTWIIQELTLARQVTIRCGDASVDWQSLCGTMQVRHRWLKTGDLLPPLSGKNSEKVDRLVTFRPLDRSRKQHSPLTATLLSTKDQSVTDARDKIYGVMGISSDAAALVPKVSYKLPAMDVFTNLTVALIKASMRLDVICYKSPYASISPQTPTWAMNLSTNCFDASTNAALFSLSVPSGWIVEPEYYRAKPEFTVEKNGIPTILKVSALMIGFVDGLGAVEFSSNTKVNPKNDYGVIQADSSTIVYPSDECCQTAIFEALTQIKISGEYSDDQKIKATFRKAWASLDDPKSQQQMQDVLAFRWSTRDRDLVFQGRKLKDWTFEKLAQPALSRMAAYMSRLEELSLSNEPENSSLQGTETALTTEESEDSASHEAEGSQELDVAGEPAEHNSIDERAEQIQGWLSSKGIPIPSQVVMEHVVSSMRIRSKPFRRLLITSSGYISNVHPQAQKDD